VYGTVAVICIILPVFLIGNGSSTTDIIGGTCVPWGVYNSYAAEKNRHFIDLNNHVPFAINADGVLLLQNCLRIKAQGKS